MVDRVAVRAWLAGLHEGLVDALEPPTAARASRATAGSGRAAAAAIRGC